MIYAPEIYSIHTGDDEANDDTRGWGELGLRRNLVAPSAKQPSPKRPGRKFGSLCFGAMGRTRP